MDFEDEVARVVIADYHPIAPVTLRSLLQTEPLFDVVAVVHDGNAAVQSVLEARAHLLIVDLGLPPWGGFEMVDRARHAGYRGYVIALSSQDSTESRLRAMQLGLQGCVHKSLGVGAVLVAANRVARGSTHFESDARDQLLLANALLPEVNTLRGPVRSRLLTTVIDALEDRAASPLDRLTPLERTVLEQFMAGIPEDEIARELGLRPRTITSYRRAILTKLRAALARHRRPDRFGTDQSVDIGSFADDDTR